MGIYFSDKIEEAVNLLFTQYDKEGFRYARQLLLEAAQEQRDADALYFLSLCWQGKEALWQYCGLKQDSAKAAELLKTSVAGGSACGILGALKAGLLTKKMASPEALLQAREAVQAKAAQGHPYCQFLIAGLAMQEDLAQGGELSGETLAWFEQIADAGYYSCLAPLVQHYQATGNNEQLRYWVLRCADGGAPDYQEQWAGLLAGEGRSGEASSYYRQAGESGQASAWHSLGILYKEGNGVPANPGYAFQCFEQGAEGGHLPSAYELGRCLFEGDGCEKDYGRAFPLLEQAVKANVSQAYPLLGHCCLKAYGTPVDYERARILFEREPDSLLSVNGLGEIYADGLGVEEDIETGVSYFQLGADLGSQDSKNNLSRFKRSLFGGWKRR